MPLFLFFNAPTDWMGTDIFTIHVSDTGGLTDSRDLVVTVQQAGEMVGTGFQSKTGKPETFQLFQNHPNPFNPVTTITFALPKRTDVT